jgi:flagellar protein FliO/FliZ
VTLADPASGSFGPGLGGLAAVAVVLLALVGASWLLRRGALGLPSFRKSRAAVFTVETAFSLGERRSLAIVTVEGRRLLLGLTPGQISLVTELPRDSQAFSAVLERRAAPGDAQ